MGTRSKAALAVPVALFLVAASTAVALLTTVGVPRVGRAEGQLAEKPTRLAGTDRFETAVLVSRHRFPEGAARVYAVRADLNPDALVGSFDDGPTLLVPQCGAVPLGVIEEIRRLSVDEVVVVGGEAAVSGGVANQLQARRSSEDHRCPSSATGQVELLLETAEDPGGLRVLGRVRNSSTEPVSVTRGYDMERQQEDGSWQLINGPHMFDDDDETLAGGQTDDAETFVPYSNEEDIETYLSPGTYRFLVNVGAVGSSDYQSISAVLTID